MAPIGEHALVVIDVQRGFDDLAYWSPTARRDNPDCEANVATLIAAWRARRAPIVFVRHDSTTPGSPLARGTPGNDFKAVITGTPDLLVSKAVNSAFHGDPDLASWLRERELCGIVVCGIQTNHCVSTTARVGANLGFDVIVAIDACHTFDRAHPDGEIMPAALLARATATTLHGEFANVNTTQALLAPESRLGCEEGLR